MACVFDFDKNSLPAVTECPEHPLRPWSLRGFITWIGQGSGLRCFDVGGHRVLTSITEVPDWFKVGAEVEVSFDGQKSRIELVS